MLSSKCSVRATRVPAKDTDTYSDADMIARSETKRKVSDQQEAEMIEKGQNEQLNRRLEVDDVGCQASGVAGTLTYQALTTRLRRVCRSHNSLLHLAKIILKGHQHQRSHLTIMVSLSSIW